MKLTPFEQMPPEVREMNIPVLLYGGRPWLKPTFFVGIPDGPGRWVDSVGGMGFDDGEIRYFAILPYEPPSTRERMAEVLATSP